MKTEWNASQYLRFENQRNQPIMDLLNRLKHYGPKRAVDLGCGPGNSTVRLQGAFPQAQVIGIDSSGDMIARAREAHPEISFLQKDVRGLEEKYDLIFSNACLQWIPDHAALIPQLMEKLNPGGVLAAQFPMNQQEPLYRIIDAVSGDPKWGFEKENLDYNGVLKPEEYFDLLASCCSGFQLWETKYYHNLPDHQALVEWVKGTKIRPYLACLDAEQQSAFETEILERAQRAYPAMQNGEVILCFNRFFLIGEK